jgi:hypothetical protein
MRKTICVGAICLLGFLTAGATIAWSTVTLAFVRFYRAEGTLLKVTNYRFSNPIMTPCFCGAIAFCGRPALGCASGEGRRAARTRL